MISIQRPLLCAASSLALSMACVPALAQTAPADSTKAAATAKTGDQPTEVVVTGLRSSLRDAISQKRMSENIVE